MTLSDKMRALQARMDSDDGVSIDEIGHLFGELPALVIALEDIVDCYGVGSSPEAFCRNVEAFMFDAREILKRIEERLTP